MEFVVYEIIAIIVLVCLYAMFSGLEIAIVGVRRSKVFRLYTKKVPGSASLYKLKLNAGKMTAGVNLGNTLVNVSSSVLAADVAIKLLGNQGVGIAIGIMTFVILIFGEILPKLYANVNPAKMSLRFSGVLLAFTYIMYPFVLMLEYLTKSFLKLAGGYSYPKPITEEDIKEVLDQGLTEKAIEKEEHMLAKSALEFDDKPIGDVMTPKGKLFSLSADIKVSQGFPKIKKTGFSRVPIYEDNPDNIVGIVHIWDLAKLPEKNYEKTTLKDIARKPIFVYSQDKISSLLLELKESDIHMAVVVNENEDLVGCITVEDLLEEIVGDIAGEVVRKKKKQ